MVLGRAEVPDGSDDPSAGTTVPSDSTVADVSGWADANWMRVVGYSLVGLVALVAAWRERPRVRQFPHLWPTFWLLTAVLLVVLAVGRAGQFGELLAEYGREKARDQGWYQTRRSVQAAVVVGLSVAWFVAVIVAVWRIPERRRRYLPMVLVVITILAFVAVRMVSLHQIDAVLYRRRLAGVRIGALTELCLQLLAIGVALVAVVRLPSASRSVGSSGRPAPPVPVP